MRKLMTAGLVLSALFAASGNPSQAASAADSTCTGWMRSVCLSHATGPHWTRQVSEAPLAFFPHYTMRNFATLNGISA
jgi:hypothetical protein